MRNIIFILACFPFFAFGQSVEDVIAQSNQALNKTGLGVDMVYEVFDLAKSTQKLEESQAKFIRFDDGYFQKLGNITIIRQDSLLLTINSDNKEISLQKTFEPFQGLTPVSLSDLPEDNVSSLLKEEGQNYLVDLNFVKSTLEVDKIQMSINKETHLLNYMELKFVSTFDSEKETLMRIRFKNYSENNIRQSDQSIPGILKIEQDQIYILNNEFENYKKRFNI